MPGTGVVAQPQGIARRAEYGRRSPGVSTPEVTAATSRAEVGGRRIARMPKAPSPAAIR
jgi:hypothetical protein